MNETLVKGIIENTNWEDLNTIISAIVGKPVTFDVINNGTRISIVSKQDFKEDCGVMSSVYKTVKLEDFGIGFNEEKNTLFVPLDWRFEYKSGGCNGANLISMIYYFDHNKWLKR